MDKNAIKKYAVWARNELIARVSQRAQRYGITKEQIVAEGADSINGKILTDTEKRQRQALIQKIKTEGFEQVMEEVAYTWFNRFSALRFMEVNGYLPSHVRVFTDQNNAFKPEIMAEAIHLDLAGLDMEKVYTYKEANNDDELFKYLIITQCNDLSSILPGMFQKIADYTELLFPDNLLRDGSVIEQMISLIPEEDWKDQVQIIGWLYQYYNSEPKDQVFADLKKNKKITKEKIPAATQLFTPDWIVRYMVENSLGRLWVEGHPNDELKSQWKYYLDEAEQEPDVQKQLAKIREEYAALKPEDIKCIDPCCGSGHILAYMFDVLIQIYGAYGISAREAASSIVKNNIYGLDIDERAAQLANFSVMMKARQYDRRFLSRGILPMVYAIQESNNLDSFGVEQFEKDNPTLKIEISKLIKELHDAKEYGSILNVSQINFDALNKRLDECSSEISIAKNIIEQELNPLVKVAHVLANKYHVVVTNPPYMGQSGMTAKMSEFIKKRYPSGKADLFAVFIERANELLEQNGFRAMITQHGWMFLGGYEKLRTEVIDTSTIINMAHLGARAFDEIGGEVVQTTAFVTRKLPEKKYRSKYIRLIDEKGESSKEKAFFIPSNIFLADELTFSYITGNIIAYWLSPNAIRMFKNRKLSDIANACKGLDTGNNDRFLRRWFEVDNRNIRFNSSDNAKWVPYNKGGGYRKWYGLNEYLIDWENDGYQLKYKSKANIRNEIFYFKQGITWSDLSTNYFGARYFPEGFIFDASGPSMFTDERVMFGILAYINSIVYQKVLDIVCPGLHYNNGAISKTPVPPEDVLMNDDIQKLAKLCIALSKEDWDSRELSWDFMKHSFIDGSRFIRQSYNNWSNQCKENLQMMKSAEEKINAYFINEANLDNEINPHISDQELSLLNLDEKYSIVTFISYAIGCVLGRYSLDKEGLIFAGGEWDASKYQTFPADKDGIVPICDDEYFEDDIVGLFVKFVETVYGKDTLDENLKFIAEALGGKGSPRTVIRNYFLNDFYADHCKMYQKRPIYWLFDSGKKNGFKCLIYMHRYQPDTIARIRTDYVHEQQSRYRTAIADLEQRIDSASTSERVKLSKKLKHLQEQSAEIHNYEEKIHHLADQFISIDLDDGVKTNYAKFQDVLAKIK